MQQGAGEIPDEEIILPPKKKAKDPDAEWRLQVKCVKFLRALMKVDRSIRFIAPQAENPRDPKRANIAKMMGLQAGVFDLIILRHGKAYFIELKRRGGRLSGEQQNWWGWFEGNGFAKFKCESLEEFTGVINAIRVG